MIFVAVGCGPLVKIDLLKKINKEVVASLKVAQTEVIGSCSFNSSAQIVNQLGFSYILSFSEEVDAGVISSQTILNLGTGGASDLIWSIQDCGDNKTFKIEAAQVVGDGTILPDISNILSALNKPNKTVKVESDEIENTIHYDTQAPAIQINQSSSETIGNCSFEGTNDPTNISGFSYKVAFSEKINPTTFSVGDITNIGTGGGNSLVWGLENCGDDQYYKLTANSINGDGTVIPIILAGTLRDLAGNANTVSLSVDNSITYDTASLLVNINQSVAEIIGACSFLGTTDPSNSTGIAYKVVFSKNIDASSFSTSDLTNSGTSGNIGWSLESCADGRTFKIVADTIQYNGTVIPSLASGSVVDSLGNGNEASTGIDSSITYDTIAPTVTINQSSTETIGSCSFFATNDPTNLAGFSYKVIFSENINTGTFSTADITNTGTSGTVTWNLQSCGNSRTFKLTASSILTDGTVVPVVSAGGVSDLAGNLNTISTSVDNSVTYDTAVPSLTINQATNQIVGSCTFIAANDPTNVAGFSYRIAFSKAIDASTFTVADISNAGTGGSVSLTWLLENCGDDQNFKLTASAINGNGTIIPAISASRVSDSAGNMNTLSTSTDNSVTYDSIVPSVSINQGINQTIGTCSFVATSDPTNAASLNYRVTFSETINVSTFTTDDITNTGTGGASSLTWTVENCGDNQNFKLIASSISGNGTIIPEISANIVSDLAGNTNTASVSTDNSITFDNVRPSVTINQANAETVGSCSFSATTDPTHLTGFSYKIVFSEAINASSFTSGDIVNNGTSGVVVWNLESCGDSQNFKLTASSIILDGTVVPVVSANSVSDAAGNLNTVSTSTDNSVTFDSAPPSVTINQSTLETVGTCSFSATNDPTNTAGFSYKISFSEIISSSSFNISDISNTGSGGATTLDWELESCGDDQHYKLIVNSVVGNGTIIPRIAAGQVYDLAGNLNTLSTSTDNSITFDSIVPTVTVNQSIAETVGSCSFSASSDPTNAASLNYRVTFSENINLSSFTSTDIVNTGTGGASGLTWAITSCGDSRNFRLTASAISGDGTIVPTVSANSVSDLAGNLNTLSTATDNSITYDTTGPSIVISRSVLETIGTCNFTASNASESTAGFKFKIAFSEKINASTFTLTDITNAGTGGASTLNWSLTNCGDNQNYRLTVTSIAGEGTVIPTIAASSLTDEVGNQNSLSTSSNGTVLYELLGWKQEAYIKASNAGSNDAFGISLAIDGDTLVVGASKEDSMSTVVTNGPDFSGIDQSASNSNEYGAAYVFKRNGNIWEQEAYIKPSNPGSFDFFGSRVALSGDTIIVGVSDEDSNGTLISSGSSTNGTDAATNYEIGAVYVFKRTGNTWAPEAYIKASNSGYQDAFGASVSISGDTISVGAIGEDSTATTITNGPNFSSIDTGSSNANNSGAVYTYKRTGSTWTQESYIKALNPGSNDQFGCSTSISGDTLAVAACAEDSNATSIVNGIGIVGTDPATNYDSGAIYIYKRTSGAWAHEAYIKSSNSGQTDYFGTSVSLSGDTLAVGAFAEDSNTTTIESGSSFVTNESASNSGAVYVFRRAANTWAQEAYIKAANAGANDEFGRSISLSSDTLAVGAAREDSNATIITNGTGFSGTDLSNSEENGAVYVYKRTGSTWVQEAYLKAVNNRAGDAYGTAVSISGDTIAVGAIGEDSAANTITNGSGVSGSSYTKLSSGAVYVYRNNARVFNTKDAFSSNVSSTSITLNWVKSGFKTTGYYIAYAEGFNAPVDCSSGNVVNVGNNTSYTFNSLKNGTYYSFRICSYDSTGSLSSGYVITFPTASLIPEPGALTYVVNSDRQATISWASAGAGVTGYRLVYQLGKQAPATCSEGTIINAGNVLNYQVTGLLTNTDYAIRVCSYDGAGNLSHGKYTSFKTDLTINPTNIVATSTALTNNELILDWMNSSDRVTGFLIARNLGATPPSNCGSGTVVNVGNVTSYTISGLSAGRSYAMRICSYEAGLMNISTGTTLVANVRNNGWVQEAFIKPSNASTGYNYFGDKVALNGETLVVGSRSEDANSTVITNGPDFSGLNLTVSNNNDYGAVYVYKRTGNNWKQEAYLKPSRINLADYFGSVISISGDTIAVGVNEEDSNGTLISSGTNTNGTVTTGHNIGAVYVFKRTGNNWAQEAYIKASNSGYQDYFGSSVSIDADTLSVGAIRENSTTTTITNGASFTSNDLGSQNGAVYVYKRNSGTWTHEAYIKSNNNGNGDMFGCSNALSGNTLVVGACFEDSDATAIFNGTGSTGVDPSASYDSGAVYVFKRSGNAWAPEAYIKASNGGAGDNFGTNVSISGDIIAVSAHLEDSNTTVIESGTSFTSNNSATDSGAVYIFKRIGSTWSQEAYIKATNAGADDQFGASISLSGDTLAVGTIREDSNGTEITNGPSINGVDSGLNNNSGAVYVYKRTAGSWAQEAYIKAVNNNGSDAFANSVSLSGDTLVIGSKNDGVASNSIIHGTGFNFNRINDALGAVHVYRNNSRLFGITNVFSTVTSDAILLKWNKTGGKAVGYAVNIDEGIVTPQLCSISMDYDVADNDILAIENLTPDTDYSVRFCVYDSSNNFVEDKVINYRTKP